MVSEVTEFVKVVGQGHGECILRCLKKSWESNHFSNVTIICRDQLNKKNCEGNLFANKSVLAAASKRLAQVLDGTEDDVVMIVPDYDRATFKLLLEYIHSGQVYLDTPSKELEKLIREWGIDFPEVFQVKSHQINKSSSKSFETPFLSSIEMPNTKNKPTGDDIGSMIPESQVVIEVCKLESNSVQVRNNGQKQSDYDSKKNKSNKRKIARISQENNINTSKLGEIPGNDEKKVVVDNIPDGDEEMEDKSIEEDLSSSLNLLKKEQSINQEMAKNISDLTDTVRRYKVYARHLLGVETSDSNPGRNGKMSLKSQRQNRLIINKNHWQM